MQRHEHVLAGRQPERLRDSELAEASLTGDEAVDHRIADEVHA